MRRSTVVGALAAVALGILVWRFARREPSEEERILALLDDMRQAAIDRRPAGILTHVAQGYRDDSGMSRDELRAYLTAYFLGSQKIGVTVIRRSVDLQGTSAVVDLRLLVARDGQHEGRRVVLRMTRGEEDWQIHSSLHEPLLNP